MKSSPVTCSSARLEMSNTVLGACTPPRPNASCWLKSQSYSAPSPADADRVPTHDALHKCRVSMVIFTIVLVTIAAVQRPVPADAHRVPAHDALQHT